jgi:glutamate transport system substrate-binding protein
MRFLPIAAVAAALSLALTACGGSDSLGGGDQPPVDKNATFAAGSTMERLQKAGTIKVGTKFDQPLFGLKGLDGAPQGFDVEIAKLVAAKLGIPQDRIEWTETPSQTREEVIEQGKVDMIVATYTINDKRKQRVSFAGPYYQAGQDLLVKSDNSTITGPESLRASHARVCSVTGSSPAEEIKKYVDAANLTLFDVYSKCADALRTGQVDVVTTDNVILMGLAEKSGGSFKVVGKRFTEEPYGIGIKKGDVQFCEFIHDTLQEAAANGSYEKAWQSTAGRIDKNVPKLPELAPCS